MMELDTSNICSLLKRKLFEEDGQQEGPILAGKATPKVLREDRINECIKRDDGQVQ